jgi:hypothetical protein
MKVFLNPTNYCSAVLLEKVLAGEDQSSSGHSQSAGVLWKPPATPNVGRRAGRRSGPRRAVGCPGDTPRERRVRGEEGVVGREVCARTQKGV